MTNTNTGGMFSKLLNPDTAKPNVKKLEEEKYEAQSPSLTEKGEEKEVKKASAVAVSEKQPVERIQPQLRIKEIRMTLPLPTGSMEFLDQMEREIFLKRPVNLRSKQRLTKNSILRAWVVILKEIKANINKEALYQLKK
jgi:hypothetical protein